MSAVTRTSTSRARVWTLEGAQRHTHLTAFAFFASFAFLQPLIKIPDETTVMRDERGNKGMLALVLISSGHVASRRYAAYNGLRGITWCGFP